MSLTASQLIEVEHVGGEKTKVEVKRLTIRQLYEFVDLLGGMSSPSLVALCVGRPVDWVDGLTDESFAKLQKICHEQNFQRASVLAKEDPILAVKMAPFLRAVHFAQEVAASMAGQPGSASSPAPAHSAYAVETGSAAST